MGNDFNRGIRVYLETSDYGKGINAMVAATQKYESAINELTEKSKQMTAAGQNSGKAWEDLQRQLKLNETQLKKSQNAENEYRQKMKETEKVLKNLSGVSYNELIQVQKQLQKELKATTRGTDEHKTKLQQLEKVNNEVADSQREMNNQYGAGAKGISGFIGNLSMMPGAVGWVGRSLLGLGDALGAFIISPTMIAITAIVGLIGGMFMLAKHSMEFGKAVSNLSALTGAVGKDLDFLKDKAKDLARQYGLSATEIVTSMKLVGSAKPELLSNVSALSDMTAAVLTLTKATGMDMTEATQGLTTIMNQFSLSAAEGTRVINVLAAGSKYGSVEVDYLKEAISKVGTIAKSAGLSLEQTTAAMELFGEKGVKAEIAGNGFKKVLIELQSDTKNYKNGIFDLNLAIDNNQKIAGNNIKLQQKFGQEFFNVAQILFQGKDRFNELTKQVTGTNTAFEQAAIATDNLSGDVDKMSASWDAFMLSLEDGKGPISNTFRSLIQWAKQAVDAMAELTKSDSQSTDSRRKNMANERLSTFKDVNKSNLSYSTVNDEINFQKKVVAAEREEYSKLYKELSANTKTLQIELNKPFGEMDEKIVRTLKMKNKNITDQLTSIKGAIIVTENYINSLAGLRQEVKTPISNKEKTDLSNPEDELKKKLAALDKELKAKEKAYKESQLELIDQLRNGQLTEDTYNQIALQTQLSFLEEKKELQKKYGQSTIDVDIEISKQKSKIQKDGDAYILKSMQNAQKAELSALDGVEKAKLLQIKDDYLNGIIPTREQYEQEIEDLEIQSLEKRLKAQRDYVALLKKITNPTDEQKQEIASTEAAIITTQNSINDKRIKSEEKFQKDKNKLIAKYAKDSILGQYELQKAALDKQHADGILSEEEYQQELLKLRLGVAAKYVQQVQPIIQAASDFVSAKKDAEIAESQVSNQKELSSLNELYNSKQITEEEYNKRKEKLQYDQSVKELDIQKKYADAEFAMKVANIGASTAMGIINAWASSMVLGPIAGPIAAGIMTALLVGTAAAQVSAASSERDKIKAMTIDSPASSGVSSSYTGARVVNQAAEGRWNVMGEDDGVVYRNVPYRGVARTGIVNSPTLVAERGDELIVDNPTLRNIRMNAPWVLNTIRTMRVAQRAEGNYSSLNSNSGTQSGSGSSVVDNSAILLSALDRMIALLEYLRDNGVIAPIVLTELDKAYALRAKSEKKGSIG